MIKHHPTFEQLSAYVAGDLPASLAAGVSIHAQMCPQCQQQIALLTEQIAEASFDLKQARGEVVGSQSPLLSPELSDEFEQMMESIFLDESIEPVVVHTEKTLVLRETEYTLPRALHNMPIASSANIGKLTRARVMLDEGDIHTSLLHIEPGGSVPMHTHAGYELTVLVAGEFSDEMGEYCAGDFIMLNVQHEHHPVSVEGCLCYTVSNAPQKFTQGINKLLNPIGNFIY